MSSRQWSLIGEGKIFIGLRSGGKMRHVGQVKEFKLEVSEETKELKNYEGGGGLADSVSFISKVEASLNFASLSSQNLAMALRGVDSVEASVVKTDEALTAYRGGILPLAGIGPTSVTLKKASDDSVIPVSEYEITSAGLIISDTSTIISDAGTAVKVSYTTTAGTTIQTLVSAGNEYRIIFSGTNFARAGKPMSVEMHRVKFSPPKDLSLISDDFAALTLTGTVLKDDTKTGVDISAFCTIRMVEN
ncbi:MAG: hypothetical protein HQL84_18870 [Magnetococcales bacterium]|nr:hypothetical protein [Magnetococcales bacterium]MBF0152083.1 hypothetical protein [Magnetococcales bacterium]